MVRNLGLIIDSDLKFTDHVNAIVRSCYGLLRILYCHKKYLPRTLKALLANSLILNKFNYMDIVYGPALSMALTEKIERVQKSCIRFIFGLRRRDHVSHRLKTLDWLNMANRRKLHLATLTYTIIKNRNPVYLYNKFKTRDQLHNLNIRSKLLLNIPRFNSQFYKKSFTYAASHLYNTLPPRFKDLSLNGFKTIVSNYFKELQFSD